MCIAHQLCVRRNSHAPSTSTRVARGAFLALSSLLFACFLVSALEHEMSKRSHVSSLKSADLTVDKEREAVRALGEARTAEGKTWNSDVQYVLAAIGSAIGLGNFLRFPSLAYRYGGAAFLIPYVLAIVLVGIPIMGLECHSILSIQSRAQ